MENIKLSNFGPIKEAQLNFADLTILIGPHATGKSVLLQLCKLLVDGHFIRDSLNRYGFISGSSTEELFERYFGNGMYSLINSGTSISFNDKILNIDNLVAKEFSQTVNITVESVFYIPALRILSMQKGWPSYFSTFGSSVPYVLRNFSESLRVSLDVSVMNLTDKYFFPRQNRLKKILQDSIETEVYNGNKIEIENTHGLKFVLNVRNKLLLFEQWSTGQKEFFPLLLSLYWLLPMNKFNKRMNISTVIIEEPEMGLHPNAIKTVILQVMELLSRGYKVVISTHSNILLDFVWAFNLIKENKGSMNDILALFDIKNTNFADSLADVLSKKIKTYYFKHSDDGVEAKDISSLDAYSDDKDISEWGGISSFSSTASEIVARLVSMNGKN